jgi:hypothetical protein
MNERSIIKHTEISHEYFDKYYLAVSTLMLKCHAYNITPNLYLGLYATNSSSKEAIG